MLCLNLVGSSDDFDDEDREGMFGGLATKCRMGGKVRPDPRTYPETHSIQNKKPIRKPIPFKTGCYVNGEYCYPSGSYLV